MAEQLYATNSLGGYYSVPQLSKEIRIISQPMMKFRKYCKPMDLAGRNKGDIVYFTKNSNPTSNGGTISETSTIPKTGYTVVRDSLSITEYGVAIPYTQKLQSLGEISVDDVVRTSLRNSLAKVLDSAAGAQFETSDYKAVILNTASTVFSSAGAVTDTATSNMSDKNVRDIVDRLKILNVPRWDGSTYQCIASTNMIRGLYDFFEPKIQQTSAAELRSGSLGVYYGCQFEEETNFLSNVMGVSSNAGEAVFFGEDAVREGIVVGEEIRMNTPIDFGRDLAIAWYYLGGFKIVWQYSTDSSTRIIHVTSAA